MTKRATPEVCVNAPPVLRRIEVVWDGVPIVCDVLNSADDPRAVPVWQSDWLHDLVSRYLREGQVASQFAIRLHP